MVLKKKFIEKKIGRKDENSKKSMSSNSRVFFVRFLKRLNYDYFMKTEILFFLRNKYLFLLRFFLIASGLVFDDYKKR